MLKTSAVSYGVFRPEENKVVRADEVSRARLQPRKDTVLVSRMNTIELVGASAYVERDWPDLVLPDRIWSLTPRTGRADGRWLHYLLSSKAVRRVLIDVAGGTSGSMKNISQNRFLGMEVDTPPLPEQQKMAAILSSMDETIERTTVVIDQIHAVKKAMMQELLTQGIPGRHTRFERTRIGEMALFVGSGSTPRGGHQAYVAAGIPFLRSQNVHFEGLRLEDVAHISISTHEAMFRTQVRPGDVLLNITGASIGRCTTVPDGLQTANVNQHVCIIRLDPAKAEPAFVSAALSSDAGQREINNAQAGLSRQGLNFQGVRGLPIDLPPIEAQREIARQSEGLNRRIACEQKVELALRQLKSALLSALLSGEIQVTPDKAFS
ncbi:MAG: restriction endonuclease subunit S [Thermoanaerobaculia bacterium]|nr:restriction endonuclease subunit S [Thermoanaerobaculia bacterium]